MAPLSRGILFVSLAVFTGQIKTNGESLLDQYRYCSRPCVPGSPPKICRYEFSVSEISNSNSVCYVSPGNTTETRSDCPEGFLGNGILGINGMTPGPKIEICLGDTLEVILKNGLGTSEVSLHWHGIRQKGSAHMDGVPMVTQCPVLPFSIFRYEIKPERSGGHLYYAQSAAQQGDGLYGALIVRDPGSDPSLEKTLLISTRFEAPLTQLWPKISSPINILVNGMRDGSRVTVDGNRRYLMRLINANAIACPVVLSVASHQLLVVAVDGEKVQRQISASHVVLFPGTGNRMHTFCLWDTVGVIEERGMEWTRDKTLELLHAYQQRRVLWDWSARGYRDRTKRRRAIQELADVLRCNTLEIEKKITNLKCQYSREVHKIQNSRDVATGPEDIYVSKWFAFKAMQFLQFGTRRYSKRKKKVDQLKLEEEEYIVSDIDPESIAFHDCSDGTNGSATGSMINVSLSEDAEESFSTNTIRMEERLGVNLMRGDEDAKVEGDETDNERRKSKEDFIKFGESIAAQLAQVPDSYSRSVAKLRINQILFEAEIGVYAQTRS